MGYINHFWTPFVNVDQWIPKCPGGPLGSTGDPAGMWLHIIVTCFDEFWKYCRNVVAGESGLQEKSLGTYDADEAAVCLRTMNVRLYKYFVSSRANGSISRARCIRSMYNLYPNKPVYILKGWFSSQVLIVVLVANSKKYFKTLDKVVKVWNHHKHVF